MLEHSTQLIGFLSSPPVTKFKSQLRRYFHFSKIPLQTVKYKTTNKYLRSSLLFSSILTLSSCYSPHIPFLWLWLTSGLRLATRLTPARRQSESRSQQMEPLTNDHFLVSVISSPKVSRWCSQRILSPTSFMSSQSIFTGRICRWEESFFKKMFSTSKNLTVWQNAGPILRRNRPPNKKRLCTRVTL